jgi:hypothetical protein
MHAQAPVGALLVVATFLVSFDLGRHSVPPDEIRKGASDGWHPRPAASEIRARW